MPDHDVFVLDLKTTKVGGCTFLRDDGSPVVVINSRNASDRQLRAYAHEIGHGVADDFENENVQLIESAAHGR